MEIYWGKPESMEGRQEREIRTYELLDSLNIPYQRTDHDAAFTMEECDEVDSILQAVICKNLFLCNRQKTAFYLLMMPGDKVFKTKDLSHQIGSARLSFASGEDMERLLDISPGACSVMGLMNDSENKVQLLVDDEVLEGEFLGCHPCVNTASLKMKVKDVFEIFLPAVNHGYIPVHLEREQKNE